MNSIWANRYSAGTGWGTAELIETNDTSDAEYFKLAVDGNGNAIVVWSQYDGSYDNIYANRYVAGTGWGTAELIETDDTGEAFDPQVAVDLDGNAIAVWSQYDGTRYNICSNNYVAGTGWGTAKLIETDNTGVNGARLPQVAIDGNGNAVAVWIQDDGARDSILSNRYTAGTGWGTAEFVEIDNLYFASNPQVAIDSSGNVIVVWEHEDGEFFHITSNRFE